MDSLKSPSYSRKDSPPNATTHKTLKQKLDRLESTVTALPQAFCEYIDAFGAFCLAGIKLASLLETVFQETPVLLIALRFREACEHLGDKCSKSSLFIKQDIVPPVKKFGPVLGMIRNRVETHAKVLGKHEMYFKQLESLKMSQNHSKTKMEQVEEKFQLSAEEFAKEDSRLAEALNDVHTMRVEVMGSSFLGFLEAQSKLLTAASDVMAPLGAFKDVGRGLNDSPSNSNIKEATVGWLSAAQINHNLRSFGGLNRNDVQCMMYNQSGGLPDTIRIGLNNKVDTLLKTYALELQRSYHPHHKVLGGFHLNPKGIEIALRDCCTELEALGAGAPHSQTQTDKMEQVSRDVPRTSYKIQNEVLGCAMGEAVQPNIKQKLNAITTLIQNLPLCTQSPGVSKERVEEFAFHILNDSCTTVTNTAAKTAVQLVFGKANLVLVRPSPSSDDYQPVDVSPRQADSSVQVTVLSSWWLVEDYAAFSMLNRPVDPDAVLGIVDATYNINLSLQNFLKDLPPDLPSIAVSYRQPSDQSSVSSQVPQSSGSYKEKDKLHTFNRTLKTFLRKSISRNAIHTHKAHNSSHKSHDSSHKSHDSSHKSHDSSHTSHESSHKSHDTLLSRSPKASSFQSYVSVQHNKDREEEDSSGDSPSSSPRELLTKNCENLPRGHDSLESLNETTPYSRRVSSGVDSDPQDLTRSSGSGTGRGYSTSSKSDSLGRNTRPLSYYHPLKRHGSNESMSSQSTLVKKEPYEEVESSYGIMDLIGPQLGHARLTHSQIDAHMRSEARKHHHGNTYRKVHAERDGGDDFDDRGELYSPDKPRRRQQGGDRGLRHAAMTTEDDGSGQSPRQMQVSPGDDQEVHIASDSEVQSVIEFLSRTRYSPDNPTGGEEERYQQEFPSGYSNNGYMGSYHGEVGMSHDREVGEACDHMTRTDCAPPHGDNASSGISGTGIDNFRGSGHHSLRSRSTSRSPTDVDSERTTEVKRGVADPIESGISLQPQPPPGHRQRDMRSHDRSRMSQEDETELMHLEREIRNQKGMKRKSQEVSLPDFSKGFGPLIPNDPHQPNSRFGMEMLQDSVDFKMGLNFYKPISDSDSVLSGHISVPPLSSPSSGSQSPLVRTRSAENVSSIERSSSRSSTHSMPYIEMGRGSSTNLDERSGDFNHAPGGYLPHPRHRGIHPYPEYDYEDRLSQDSVDGSGRSSLSQGSHDSHDWEWNHHDNHMRGGGQLPLPSHRNQYPMDYGRPPYDFKGAPPPRVQGPPQYDSPLTHDRQPCPMHRNPMNNSRDDYSPSPGPHGYDRGGHQPPMMGGQNHWGSGGGYDASYEPSRMRTNSHGPAPQGPPISAGGHHPSSMGDRGFRPVPYHSTTPSDVSSPANLPVMSPAPSPRPTPPPTPPPHNPNMMGSGHGHGPGPPLPGPHSRPHHLSQGPPPQMGPLPPGPQYMGPRPDGMGPRPDGMGPRPDGPRQPGPPMRHRGPWDQGGPPPHDFAPPTGPRGMMAGPGPPLPLLSHAHSPGPPMSMAGGPVRYPNHPPDWGERKW